ncbi:MAG: hypothetical protein AAF988_03790 [Pseudomonadota bacterium]
MYFCTAVVTTAIIILIIIETMTWNSYGFSRDFWKIDSCLDQGGVWHYGIRKCAQTEEEMSDLIEKYGPLRP